MNSDYICWTKRLYCPNLWTIAPNYIRMVTWASSWTTSRRTRGAREYIAVCVYGRWGI